MEKSTRAVRPGTPSLRRPGSLQLAVAVLLLIAAAGLSGYLLWVGEPAHASNEVETRVLTRPIPALAVPRETAITLARGWLRAPITLHAGARRFTQARGALGARVDVPGLTALLEASRDAGSPLRRLHARRHGDAPLDLPIPARLEGDAARGWLEALSVALAEPARGARVDGRGTVLPPRDGRVLDVEATLDALAEAVFSGATEVAAAFQRRAAAVASAGDPASQLGRAIDVATVLGRAESALRNDDPTRTHNVRVAARRLDGVLIAPGAGFDARAELEELYALGSFRPGRVVEGAVDPVEAAVSQVLRTLHAALIDAEIALLEEPWFAEDPTARVNLRLDSPLTQPCALFLEVEDGRLLVAVRGAAGDAPPEPPP